MSDVYIVDALPPYEDLIGKSVVSHRPATQSSEVLAAIDPIVPRDNDQTVRLLMPRFVLIPQIHRGLGFDPTRPTVRWSSSSASGRRSSMCRSIRSRWANTTSGQARTALHLPEDPDVSVPVADRRRPVVADARRGDALRPVQPRRAPLSCCPRGSARGRIANSGRTRPSPQLRWRSVGGRAIRPVVQ